MNLRKKTFLLGTLVGLTFSTMSLANKESTSTNADIQLNLMLEIEQNLQAVISEMNAPVINAEVAKQLQYGYLQHQTDQLVKSASNSLPTYKFRVIITE